MSLREYSFSKAKYKLLNKNLNYVLTQGKYNEKHLNLDIGSLYRGIELSAHFGSNDANKKHAKEEIFKPPSNKNWLPKSAHHTIETFIVLTSKEIDTEIFECNNMTLKDETKRPKKG